MGKKKANGEGSITKRKDGRYMGRYTVESKRKAVYGDSFEEVRQKLNEILNEIAKGAYVEPNKYSVEKWLREWLELYALPTVKRSTYISYQDQDYIFATPLGHHNDPKVYQTLFKRIVADAGIESANFHALRHTFATRALESGMDIKVLSALLGHAQASTTLNLYGHVLPDHKKISMEKMRGNYMSCSSISGSSDDTSADVPQTQDPIISTIEDAQHNQEPAISIAAEDIQGLELSGDTNTAMPQIHDSTADTNANEEQAQAS